MSDLNASSPTAQAAIQQNSQAILHFLQQYPPFNQMEKGHLLMLIEAAWLRFYGKGTLITGPNHEAEQYWFLIRQGLVQGERPNPSLPDELERFTLTTGDNFPIASILSQRSTRTTYTAEEDTFCLVLSATNFIKILRISEPLTVNISASAFDAALLMTQYHIGHVCIVKDDKLVGVVSERDLFSLQRVDHALDECGLTLCKGNIMASNPKICLSLVEWQARFAEIMSNPDPKHLLQASVFFDIRSVWGKDLGFKAMHQQLLSQIQQRKRFLRQLARAALNYPPPPSQLRRWIAKTVGSSSGAQVDLKRHGLGPFVDATRVLALSAKISEASTQERLNQLAAKGIISHKDAEVWIDAYRYRGAAYDIIEAHPAKAR